MSQWPLLVLTICGIHHDTRRLGYNVVPLGMRDDSHRIHEAFAEE